MSNQVGDAYRYPDAIAFTVAVTYDVVFPVVVAERLDVSRPVIEPVAVAVTNCERDA